MEAIRTISDLHWAQENDPELVKNCLAQVGVKQDLSRWLRYINDAEIPTKVLTTLNRWKKRSKGIHPSSACKKGVCLLKLYYECTHEISPRREFDEEMQQTWDIGTLLHDTMQAHFENMYGDQFNKEVPLRNPRLHIKSHTDGLFDFSMVRFVLEMKSIKEGGNYGWEKVQEKPMEDNVRQAHFYMSLADAPFALIFYISKNRGLFLEHPVVFDAELWKEMEETVVVPVNEAAYGEAKKPRGDPGWGCKWCDFQHSCPDARRHYEHAKGSNRQWRGRGRKVRS